MSAGPVQVAYRVGNVENAAERFAARSGAGPFFVRHHPPMPCVDAAGREGEFRHSSAYGQWGSVQVEFVVIDGEVGPRRGVHHVARFVPSLDQEVLRLDRAGWPLVLKAETPSGLAFAFCDATIDLGHLVELYEPLPHLLALYASIRLAAEEWDGHEPVRPLAALTDY